MTRIRRFSLVAVLAVLLLALGLPALAASPLTISGNVTDPDGWLSSSDRSSVEAATSKAAANGTNLYVVFVSDFSGVDAEQWCKQTSERSSLQSGTVLYVIAYTQRRDAACVYNGQSSNTADFENDKYFISFTIHPEKEPYDIRGKDRNKY